ncbi:MAG: PLP-dependent aminotransferase family protein [Planctomycetes bacterium]|nr:PLP-dependent aminotransferase family protein [Planctomycetota bacterium]
MSMVYAQRMNRVPRSFIREILKVTENPEVISFAGGLPNPRYFPVQEIAQAASEVLSRPDDCGLQYGPTEGYLPLRQYIAQRYRDRMGLAVAADEILITNGSQQGLDLVGKVFIDRAEVVAVEQPAYLGALQAFSVYEPQFYTVPLLDDGVDMDHLEHLLGTRRVRLFHTVINFQNPSGITYSPPTRRRLAEALGRTETVLVEDDPYGPLRFAGEPAPSMRTWLEGQAVLLGSFSKIVAPGLRLGWVCAPRPIMDKLVIAKQASDLHSNFLCQRILYQYLMNHDLDEHIATITAAYQRQRDAMVQAIESHFPPEVTFTRPQGGMFLWATLPASLSALDLFERAAAQKVAFVPGTPFFLDNGGLHHLRLNFSNAPEDRIEEGIRRLGAIMKQMLVQKA